MARRDPLAPYNAKRDFQRTAEPEGKLEAINGGNSFVVQKHEAKRLHWDFRIEVDGVLKSWAVTKGPSPDPDDKRLAVKTEDHPLAYGAFEGIIPQGEYGGGTVMLWDRGTWAPIEGKSAKDLDKGHLHFALAGERMKGEWIIFRLKPRPGEKRENWLLRKVADGFAMQGDVLVDRALTSVMSGRTMEQIAGDTETSSSFGETMAGAVQIDARSTDPRAKPRRKAKLPEFRAPQLATLIDAVPTGNNWMHEIKFDGYRAMIAVAGSKVAIYTRSGLDWTDKFAPLARHLAMLDLPSALIDGEIVAYGKDDNPDFSALQSVLKRGHSTQTEATPLSFHAFDLLELDGQDLAQLTNIERKDRLEALLAKATPPIHIADHIIGAGEKLFAAMCTSGQEGIISKRIDGRYLGKRSRNWLKVKCIMRQEFVIVGATRSEARSRPFSSLLLAQNEEGRLVYKGKVGTGFAGDSLTDIAARLTKLSTDTAPLDVPSAETRKVGWVKPELVAEVAFAEFTGEGRVRHASFIALRSDKAASAVVPERAQHLAEIETPVQISSRERVIFPGSGETKGDLADYYEAVAPLMLAFAAYRPISLVRCPQGRSGKCFFQKHDSGMFGENVRHVAITEKDGSSEDYLYVENAGGLLTCVQMGTIEFHSWGCRTDAIENPDRMIFDLDPDEDIDFSVVKSAARYIHDRLADIGLISFAMLSGGKGIHVIVPLTPAHSWAAHKDFAHRFAEALSMAEPDRFIATMSKAKRKGKIFIDWLRNQRGATAVLPYSARSRDNAPVAVPVAWGELGALKDAHPYNISDLQRLLTRARSKGLTGWGFAEQKLPDL